MLCRPDPDHLAGAVLQLASSPLLRRHLGASGARAARGRSWERALEQLAAGYRRALGARRRRRAASASPGPPEAAGAAGGAAVRWPDRRSGPLLQPRALLARLQPAGAGAGRGPRGAAAGAAPVLRDLRLQPRRVLHGPGRRAVRPARRRDRRPRPRRPRPGRADRRDPGPGAGARPPPARLLRRRRCGRRWRSRGSGSSRWRRRARRSGARSTPASTSRSSRR